MQSVCQQNLFIDANNKYLLRFHRLSSMNEAIITDSNVYRMPKNYRLHESKKKPLQKEEKKIEMVVR